ncbi:unnamed protein product [Haemonchus placei]|uniref:Ubiquitin-like domain-containing protein n=1 Tax=Haemonchus placei TaxID=6290 RepID=A0A158QNR7_HAEPC|nr:unnamed protein product [Haemonchus placei]
MELFHLFNVSSGHRFHVEVSLQWKVRQLQESVVQVTGIQVDDQVAVAIQDEVYTDVSAFKHCSQICVRKNLRICFLQMSCH